MLRKKLPQIDKTKLKKIYISILAVLLFLSLYHLYFSNKVIPGVVVGNTSIGGLTYKQAVSRLEEREANTKKTMSFSYNTKTYTVTSDDVLLTYNWKSTVARAFEVGRTGNIFIDTKDKIAGLFKPLRISAFYDYEDLLLDNFLSSIKRDINVPANDASFVIKNGNVQIVKESVGQKVSDKELYNKVLQNFNNLSFDSTTLNVTQDLPKISEDDLSSVYDEAAKIIKSPIALSHNEKTWNITPEQKAQFISYSPESHSLVFNNANFKPVMDAIALNINKLPKGKVTNEQDGMVKGFELTADGAEVDFDKTAEDFRRGFFSGDPVVTISTKAISGSVDPKTYGIFALLGEGNSKFSGSAAGRIKNLTLAASKTDGVLVPPNSIYSFNESVGEISAATGYDAAWIILGSRTVLGHGGGVCQTSTTLFRAALNAGLPIIERNPHAYRVRYYEIESQIGVDASVFQPSLDFRFKNDTPNYLLVQTSWNLDDQSLNFKIYGTPDGREVEITDSVITSQTPPPEPLYQDDPTLAKGVVKQIDFPAWGAVAQFTRKVTKNGETIYDDVFKTTYQPWRAIYLVGKKD